jgi:hypothetical protein
MPDTHYHTIVLIPSDVNVTFENIIDKFQYDYLWMSRSAHLEVNENEIHMQYDGWQMSISWESDYYVLDQSVQLAEQYAPYRDDAERIAQCDRRLSISSDPDPDHVFYNDYASALNVLGSSGGCFVFDLNAGEFIELDR